MELQNEFISKISEDLLDENSNNFNLGLKEIIMNYSLGDIEDFILPLLSDKSLSNNQKYSIYYAVFIFFQGFNGFFIHKSLSGFI